jgi:phospholipid/cholesterol/gamma-HCH transport system ATP-binding protein
MQTSETANLMDNEELATRRIPNDLSVTDMSTAVDAAERVVPAIEFRNVNFSYDDRPVLKDLSFKLMKSEMLIVLGTSGCGKSTILRLAIGLNKPDSGQILIDGEDITDYDEEALNRVRQRLGMDFQGGALFDSLTVYDNVAYSLHEKGVPEGVIEEDVNRILRFLNIDNAIDMLPAELSGGMRIRVGLARSLISRPHTILLDEPTTGLDPPTARSVCELGIYLRDLLDVATILVTHGLDNVHFLTSTYALVDPGRHAVLVEEGERLCLVNTKVMMLRDGRVIFHGNHVELFETKDPYIREFLLLKPKISSSEMLNPKKTMDHPASDQILLKNWDHRKLTDNKTTAEEAARTLAIKDSSRGWRNNHENSSTL